MFGCNPEDNVSMGGGTPNERGAANNAFSFCNIWPSLAPVVTCRTSLASCSSLTKGNVGRLEGGTDVDGPGTDGPAPDSNVGRRSMRLPVTVVPLAETLGPDVPDSKVG